MKRFLILTLLLALTAILPSQADIIPKDMKSIYVQANITNLDEFPDYVFMQIETLGNEIRVKKIIEKDGKVNKGYKLNRLEIIAIPQTHAEAAEDIESIDLGDAPQIIRSGKEPVECGQLLVSRPSSLAGKDVFYTVSIVDEKLVFNKTGEKEYKENPNHLDINLMAWAFFVTFIVELIVFFILRFVLPAPVPGKGRTFLCVLAAQVVTLPLLWLLITHYNLMGTLVFFGAESFAAAVEAIIYRFFAKLKWKSAIIASVVCNTISYIMGMML